MQLIHIQRVLKREKNSYFTFALHIHKNIFFMETHGNVDENVMLVGLHVGKRNTSVISRDFFLMVQRLFVFLWMYMKG